MDSHQGNEHKKKPFHFNYDKYYKLFLAIPTLLLLGSFTYLFIFYSQTGDIMHKDVSLTGGTTLTLFDGNISVKALEDALSPQFKDVTIRALTDFSTGKTIAISIESSAGHIELKKAVEEFTGYKLTEDNSSTEFSGSSLSESFYKQLIIAMLIAFAFMMIAVFVIFRKALPSTFVIISSFMDVFVTLIVVNLLGVRISTAGIAAFLMLIGYGVDNNVLLTARALKGTEGTFNSRVYSAFKTGMTVAFTSFAAFLIAYFIVISPALKQVFLILLIGLAVDILATWGMNASLLKWDYEKRRNK